MKKVLLVGTALAIAFFTFGGNATKPTTQTPNTPVDFKTQFEKAHVVMGDNGYSVVVHNGNLYYNDDFTQDYLGQYFATYGKKEMTFPKFEDFAVQFVNQFSLKTLFDNK